MKCFLFIFYLSILLCAGCEDNTQFKTNSNLKIVIIRHGEKPDKGDNLSCMGQNRALALVDVLHQKIGIPVSIFVPALNSNDETKHSRMFQTITPFAVKYNLSINSKYDEDDIKNLAKNLRKENGTTLVVWEHSAIQKLVKQLGLKNSDPWRNDDFDSIWVISFEKGKAKLSFDKEGLSPSPICNF